MGYQGDAFDSGWPGGEPEARGNGFITMYASKARNEDVAEIVSIYVTSTAAAWDAIIAEADANTPETASSTGGTKITNKLTILRTWLSASFNIDLDVWRESIKTQVDSISSIDWDNFND
jgi:substrate import-associated zinc metallohydrolase lipoprotein